MLTGIGLRNFKAFGDEMQEAPLSKITLIYGPNSGGKSSIIQAPLLLKQSLKNGYADTTRTLVTVGELADLGSVRALLHRHDTERELGISFIYKDLELRRDGAENRVYLGFSSGSLSNVRYQIASHNKDEELLDAVAMKNVHLWDVDVKVLDVFVDREIKFEGNFLPILDFWNLTNVWANAKELEHDLDRESELARSFSNRRDSAQLQTLIETHQDAQVRVRALIRDVEQVVSKEQTLTYTNESALERAQALARAGRRMQGIVRKIEPARRQSQALARIWAQIKTLKIGESNLSAEHVIWLTPETIPNDYERCLRAVNYMGPLRSAPQRLYRFSDERDSQGITGTQGEYAANALYRDFNLREEVNCRFKQFGITYQLDVIPLGEASLSGEHITIALTDKRTDTQVTLADVGYGINQILPVIIEGIASQEGAILCVEQPEIHLHPRLQANIADLMIDTIADEPGKRKQWIVETHSELLIRRIRTRIAQGDISPSDVSVLYVDPDDDDCEGSAIKQLRLDENGRFLDEWPNGFFEEGYKQARLARRARLAKDNKNAGKVRN